MKLGSKQLFALILLVGIAGTGITVRLVKAAGFETFGTLLWILGYGGMVFILWYGWLRPIDFSDGANTAGDADESESDAGPRSPDADGTVE